MQMVYKKIFLIILIIFALISFCSCESPGTELSELMIMQGIGVDVTADGYRVCVEILNNEQSGSPGGDGNSENKTKIYSADGDSVADALRKLITKSGNLPLFAHNRVIIIGEAATRDKLTDVIDFFERNYDSRASQLLCVAKKATAEEIIRAKLLSDGVKSEILENLLEESFNQSLVPRVRIIDAVNYLKDETSFLCMPSIKIEKSGENENYVLDGCALFGKDSRLASYIDSETAEGVAFLNDKIEKGVITAQLPNLQNATFLINKGKTTVRISEENGVLHYMVHIKISCDLDEVEGAEYFNKDNGVLETFQRAAGEKVCALSENTLMVLKENKGGDAVRFGRRLRLSNPDLYKKYKNDWANTFKQTKTSITADVTIRRIGEETFHSTKK